MKKKDGTMIEMLRDLKEEMVGLRNEIKEIKENWELRVDRMERKMVEIEERMKEMERRRGETGGAKGEITSDYLPLAICLEEDDDVREKEIKEEEAGQEQGKKKKGICWDEEARKLFRERTEE